MDIHFSFMCCCCCTFNFCSCIVEACNFAAKRAYKQEKSVSVLWFLPQDANHKALLLSIEVMRVIFGSVLQFCLQTSLLAAYTPEKDVKWTQYISMMLCILTIARTVARVVCYYKPADADKNQPNDETSSNKEGEGGLQQLVHNEVMDVYHEIK